MLLRITPNARFVVRKHKIHGQTKVVVVLDVCGGLGDEEGWSNACKGREQENRQGQWEVPSATHTDAPLPCLSGYSAGLNREYSHSDSTCIIEAPRGTNTNRTKNGLTYNHGGCEGAIHRDCRSYKSGTQRKKGKEGSRNPPGQKSAMPGGRGPVPRTKQENKTKTNKYKTKYVYKYTEF